MRTSIPLSIKEVHNFYCHDLLRCVHTCNFTAYRNAVTLQVTDTIRSYVPHGGTVSYERYTVGFPVCYGSPSDVFAARRGFRTLIYINASKRSGRW